MMAMKLAMKMMNKTYELYILAPLSVTKSAVAKIEFYPNVGNRSSATKE